MSQIEVRLKAAREASYKMATLSTQKKNEALENFARALESNFDFLIKENKKDLDSGDPSSPLYQRLKLDIPKLKLLVKGIREVIALSDPVGKLLSKMQLDKGLILEKQTVPIGVLGVIFESRPDVIPQILSLVLKSGNACVLKGGKEALNSNHAFMQLVRDMKSDLPESWAELLETREDVKEMLAASGYLDLIIPRGSNELVQMVMNSTKVPVLGHADGVCHLYVHQSADIAKAVALTIDGKTQYPAACNSIETLLVDESVSKDFFKSFEGPAQGSGVILKGCELTRAYFKEIEPATEQDWKTEYGDLRLAVRVVKGLKEAVTHINRFGSHHTDTIVAQDSAIIEEFLNSVDSASVMSNASTRFADGFRYGLGAEVGISTSKLHARGPVGLEGLVIHKFRLKGEGHIVSDYVGEKAKPFAHKPIS
jgi:glutamate-5-semialdehyde dehydrogenase